MPQSAEPFEHATAGLRFRISGPAVSEQTFGTPGFLLEVRSLQAEEADSELIIPLRSSFRSSKDVLAAFLVRSRLSLVAQRTNRGGAATWPSAGSAIEALRGFQRHGWARARSARGDYFIPFVDDFAIAALYRSDAARPGQGELLDATRPPPVFADEAVSLQTRRVKASIHMKETWNPFAGGVFPGVHTLGNLLAVLDPFTHQGVDDIKELIHLLWVDVGTFNVGGGDSCISELRIHSHGDGQGHSIEMGDDKIVDSSFEQNGDVKAGTQLAKLIDVLKKVMCKPSVIIFDACGGARGSLLRNISRNLGPDVTVRGFSGTGYPVGEGDSSFKNGVAQP